MASNRTRGTTSAREYAHEAALGVDRKRKKALLGKPTTPVRVGRGTTVSQLLDSYREASFQARALGKCAAVFEAMLRDRQRPTILLGLAGSFMGFFVGLFIFNRPGGFILAVLSSMLLIYLIRRSRV